MVQITPVNMGEIKIAKAPEILAVYGIGSCIIVSLYDSKTKIGGIAHIMLPSSLEVSKEVLKPEKFADTAVPLLYEMVAQQDVYKGNLVAKIVGGSEMFPPTEDFESKIGAHNIEACKRAINKLRLPIIAQNTGGNRGRSLEFNLETGMINLTSLGEEAKEI